MPYRPRLTNHGLHPPGAASMVDTAGRSWHCEPSRLGNEGHSHFAVGGRVKFILHSLWVGIRAALVFLSTALSAAVCIAVIQYLYGFEFRSQAQTVIDIYVSIREYIFSGIYVAVRYIFNIEISIPPLFRNIISLYALFGFTFESVLVASQKLDHRPTPLYVRVILFPFMLIAWPLILLGPVLVKPSQPKNERPANRKSRSIVVKDNNVDLALRALRAKYIQGRLYVSFLISVIGVVMGAGFFFIWEWVSNMAF